MNNRLDAKILFCWTYIKKYKSLFYLSIFFRILSIMTSLLVPLILASIVNKLTGVFTLNDVFTHVLLMFLLSLVSLVLNFIDKILVNYIKKNVNEYIKIELYYQMVNISPCEIQDYEQGKLFSLLSSDAASISGYFFSIVNILLSIINAIIIGIVVFLINWQLAIIALIIFPVSLSISRYYGNRNRELSKDYQILSDSFVWFWKNLISNISDLRFISNTKSIDERLKNYINMLKNKSEKQEINSSINSLLIGSVGIAGSIISFIIGIYLIFLNLISLGLLVAFNSYSKSFTSTLSTIASFRSTIQPTLVSIDRLIEFKTRYITHLNKNKTKLIYYDINGDIKFKNLSFKYDNDANNLFTNIDFSISHKKTTCIIGENGAGKSTLIKLLLTELRFYEGDIIMGDISINDLSIDYLKNKITYVSQLPFLYPVSIYNNICMSEEYSKKNLIELLIEFELFHNINSLEKNIDTIVEGNATLSIGQIRKIQLIRTIIEDKDIIVFDEFTSNIDKQTRLIFEKYLNMWNQKKTIILITHNTLDIGYCDEVFKIERNSNIIKMR